MKALLRGNVENHREIASRRELFSGQRKAGEENRTGRAVEKERLF